MKPWRRTPSPLTVLAGPEQHRICTERLIPNLLCSTTAILIEVYVVELTAPQFSDLRVTHGHGAENAGETKLSSISHVYIWSYS
jgi:hypothetical protein